VHEILDVVCGPREGSGRAVGLDAAQWLEFLDIMQKVVASGEIQEIVKEAVLLSSEERSSVLKYAKKLNESKNGVESKPS
jgi:hypothetical protein